MVENNKLRGVKITLIIGDLILATLTLLIVTILRYGTSWNSQLLQQHLIAFWPLIIVNLVTHYAFGLYDVHKRPTNAEMFMAALRSQALTTLIGAVFFYFIPSSIIILEPRRVLLGYTVGLLPLTWLWQLLSRKVIQQLAPPLKVLVLGQGQRAARLIAELEKAKYLGYVTVPLLDLTKDGITKAIENNQPDLIVNAIEGVIPPQIISALQRCLVEQRPVVSLPVFTEQVMRKVPVEDVDQWWFIENFSLKRKPIYEFIKRLSDIILSVLGLIISIPLSPFIILAVKTTPGSIFFKQRRTGKNGEVFLAMKFRSMIVNAEQSGPQWAQANDPRVTKAGRFLRLTRLDEIPQLINILKGEMSFVGPRPERPEFMDTLITEVPFYRERLLVKPGLTGWAQINYPYGDSVEDALEKLRYDLYYIKNRSIMLDISTILKTINTVLKGLGQ